MAQALKDMRSYEIHVFESIKELLLPPRHERAGGWAAHPYCKLCGTAAEADAQFQCCADCVDAYGLDESYFKTDEYPRYAQL